MFVITVVLVFPRAATVEVGLVVKVTGCSTVCTDSYLDLYFVYELLQPFLSLCSLAVPAEICLLALPVLFLLLVPRRGFPKPMPAAFPKVPKFPICIPQPAQYTVWELGLPPYFQAGLFPGPRSVG